MSVVLVTGGSGFLASRLTELLKEVGHTVITTDLVGNVDFKGDLADGVFVKKLPDADILVHLASVQYVSNNLPLLQRKKYFLKNNVQSAHNLVDRYANKAEYVIFTSTSMVYSASAQSPITIESPTAANGIYSASKIEVESIFSASFRNLAIIRPCIIAGPGRGGLFVPLQKALVKFKTRVIPGRGVYKTSVVHLNDVASLVVLLAKMRAVGVFNCAGKNALSISDWGSLLARELGVKHYTNIRIPDWIIVTVAKLTGYRALAREQLAMLRRDHFLDLASTEAIGWLPEKNTQEILSETAAAFREK